MTDFEQTCIQYIKDVRDDLEAIYRGEAIDPDSGKTLDFYDYFDDALDWDYTIDREKRYSSVKVWIAVGGPNVWIDTRDAYVRIAWGYTREELPIPYSIRDEIDEVFQQYYEEM